ncbi:hydantoinase B/oxoprolinase family protein [Thalassobaculum sp.]|uniref:hydantoinase B/oxoprolinase family protein n=1 Tax=Thalassobaculum sp. TaxID=2022740 RepID=UPI003B5AC72D
MSTNRSALDQIHIQIQWNRLLSVVEEQAQTLVRTAFSTSAREAGDISAGVFDTDGQMLAQAVTGTPGHVNAMAASVGFFLEVYPIDTMKDGDVYITNDPWKGTGHLNDITVVTPTFLDGKPVGLFACTSHVVDIGGRGFGPDGRQVYEEGLNIPIMPLAREGVVDRGLLNLVKVNVRNPIEVEGDIYSLMACNEVGGRRLVEMMREFGMTDLGELGRHIIESSRAGMLEEIGKLPKGTYHNSMRIDGFENEVDLVGSLTVSDDGIDIDFEGTSGTSRYGINVPLTYTQAYASFGVRCVIGGSIPNNAGSLGVIRITAPEGSILNAPPPCAVAARHVIGQMLPDVMLGCLNQIIPDRVPAEGTSCLWNPVLLGGRGIVDGDYGNSRPFAMNTFHTGGTGARPGKDGMDATSFPSGVRNTPVEVNETIAPLIFWKKEYRTDSGGPGTYRGGTGQVMEIAHADGRPFAISSMFDRVIHPPRGRNGGANGATGKLYLKSGPSLQGKGRQTIPAGDTLVLEMPGGGGLGDPKQRDPASLAIDVRDGFVSEAAAREAYGWTEPQLVAGDD